MDVIHSVKRRSIYDRTDYLINSDMAISFATARAWRFGIASEAGRRPGFPPVSREAAITPLVLAQPAARNRALTGS
jgi:hypothetical protein